MKVSMKKGMLACFGSHCIDRYHFDGEVICFAGGGPVNSAVHASGLGISTVYVGALGNDRAGEVIMHELVRHGMDTSYVHVCEGNSAVCDVYLEDGERILGDYDEGVCGVYSLSEADMHELIQADICLCDYWGRQEIHFPYLHEHGARIALDAADRADDPQVRKLLPYVTYLFFSAEGDDPKLREKMKQMQETGVQKIIATLGKDGSLCLDEDGFTYCRAYPAERIIDTMGAGDAYIAGFLAALIKGCGTLEAMQEGSREAAETLGYHGAFRQEGVKNVYRQ